MTDEVRHTSFEQQQAFLKRTPAEQNLQIYMAARETNGSVAEALRRIGKLESITVAHDTRLMNLERWQIKVGAVIAAAIVIGPATFYALAQLWH